MIDLAEGVTVASKYRLERRLASGGMGSVWVARHLQLDSDVAIKFMDPSFAASDEARARFETEAKASARLKSPHVVQVYDYGLEGDTPFIVMELLEGEDLAVRLARGRRLSLAETAPLCVQICKGLRAAHDVGIIHRDLKPQNIFIARHGEEDLVKILDFGVAKLVGPGEAGSGTQTGMIIGSPKYMSPEQARSSKDLDARSDLWSLGVLLFRALTGRQAFPGKQVTDILVAVCSDPITRPSDIAPELGPEVDRFFERAMCRDREGRFQTAMELASAMQELARKCGVDVDTTDSGRYAAGVTVIDDAERLGTPNTFGHTHGGAPARRAKPIWMFAAAAIAIGGLLSMALLSQSPEATGAGPLDATTEAAQTAPSGVPIVEPEEPLAQPAPKDDPAPVVTPASAPAPSDSAPVDPSPPQAVSAPKPVPPKSAPPAPAARPAAPEKPSAAPEKPKADDLLNHM